MLTEAEDSSRQVTPSKQKKVTDKVHVTKWERRGIVKPSNSHVLGLKLKSLSEVEKEKEELLCFSTAVMSCSGSEFWPSTWHFAEVRK